MILNDQLIAHILRRTTVPFSPFYIYDTELLRKHCRMFFGIPYQNKSIHFATMANVSPEFIKIVKEENLNVFVNSVMHLTKVMNDGYKGEEILFTASAMDEMTMKTIHENNVSINLDSKEQLKLWQRNFPISPFGIRCNISDKFEGRNSHAGYFLGKESRLGFSMDEINEVSKLPGIHGLHLYIGTDIFDIDYFMDCYLKLCDVSLQFPHLEYLNFGGGFGVAENGENHFDFNEYSQRVTSLMEDISAKHNKSLKMILEPGRIIGGEAGYFVCRITDIKERNEQVLIGVNASSTQFSRPLFYPDVAKHPVAIFRNGVLLDSSHPKCNASIYGCSTYSKDYLAKDIIVPQPEIGDVVILGNAGSYSASSYTHFLGFPQPEEFFV